MFASGLVEDPNVRATVVFGEAQEGEPSRIRGERGG